MIYIPTRQGMTFHDGSIKCFTMMIYFQTRQGRIFHAVRYDVSTKFFHYSGTFILFQWRILSYYNDDFY